MNRDFFDYFCDIFLNGQSGAFGTGFVRFQTPRRLSTRTTPRSFALMRANAQIFHRKVAEISTFQPPVTA
jgi:hypothetical protein